MDSVERRLYVIEVLLGDLLRASYLQITQGNQIMIDTSKALASVTALVGESASQRALLQQIHDHLVTISQQLATANANNDPTAQAKVQNDLNSIAQLADTENQAVASAISANPDVQDQTTTQPQGSQQPAPQAQSSDPAANASSAQPINQTQNPS